MERRFARSVLSLALAVVFAVMFGVVGCKSTEPAKVKQALEKKDTAPPIAVLESRAKPKPLVLEPVYFELDRFEIRPEGRAALRANAAAMLSSADWSDLTVEGHCDERGSDEYNLALGERRAKVVKQYLVDLGLPAGRLHTVSFGENKPAVFGQVESSWKLNRRSELRIAEPAKLSSVSSR